MRGRTVSVSTGTNAKRSPWRCRSEVRCLMLRKLSEARNDFEKSQSKGQHPNMKGKMEPKESCRGAAREVVVAKPMNDFSPVCSLLDTLTVQKINL